MHPWRKMDLYHIETEQSEVISNFAKQNISNTRSVYIDKGEITMENNKNILREETINFAIEISDICDNIKGCSVYINQLLRCSSSIGANLHEAKYAQSKADFVHKLAIAQKECDESLYWLELLKETKYINETEFISMNDDAVEILQLIRSIILTTKSNS